MATKIVNGVSVKLTKAEADAREAESEANAIRIAKEIYMQNRRDNYASIAEQLDMLYHDKMNSTDTWQEHITSVKTQYPKPE